MFLFFCLTVIISSSQSRISFVIAVYILSATDGNHFATLQEISSRIKYEELIASVSAVNCSFSFRTRMRRGMLFFAADEENSILLIWLSKHNQISVYQQPGNLGTNETAKVRGVTVDTGELTR